jgi:ubiquinone/menaquinone biosynthesis C-methylase UbiE
MRLIKRRTRMASDFDSIYRSLPDRYERLISFEDPSGTLLSRIGSYCDLGSAHILELGVGTGRLTRFLAGYAKELVGFDRSEAMLKVAHTVLDSLGLNNWELRVADHLEVQYPKNSADLVIEGWSFGHLILDRRAELEEITDTLVQRCLEWCVPGGRVMIIETLGTGFEEPSIPDPDLERFYTRLETVHGFYRDVVRTDFVFPDAATASDLMGFFFGEEHAVKALSNACGVSAAVPGRPAGVQGAGGGEADVGGAGGADAVVIPECTGLWHRIA